MGEITTIPGGRPSSRAVLAKAMEDVQDGDAVAVLTIGDDGRPAAVWAGQVSDLVILATFFHCEAMKKAGFLCDQEGDGDA